MLIKCPNCSVKYKIPEEIGLVEGRKLKCSDCNHVFVYTQTLVESEESQNNLGNNEEQPVMADDPVLALQEDISQAAVFLPESEQDSSKKDDLTATFTPVEQEELVLKTPYHLSLLIWGVCVVLLFGLALAGFYYADFISADYLLGVNRNSRTEMDIIRRRIAENRRGKLKQSHQAFVQRVSDMRQRNKKIAEGDDLEQNPQEIVSAEGAVVAVNETVENEATSQEVQQNVSEVKMLAPVNEPAEDEIIPQETPQSVLDAEAEESVLLNPIVTYKDKELIDEPDGSISVRMEGSIQNPSKHELVLPPVVHAVAFDENGQELFTKDIYLTNRYLDAGQTQDFFGSYHWKPENKNVQIQWIEMSF